MSRFPLPRLLFILLLSLLGCTTKEEGNPLLEVAALRIGVGRLIGWWVLCFGAVLGQHNHLLARRHEAEFLTGSKLFIFVTLAEVLLVLQRLRLKLGENKLPPLRLKLALLRVVLLEARHRLPGKVCRNHERQRQHNGIELEIIMLDLVDDMALGSVARHKLHRLLLYRRPRSCCKGCGEQKIRYAPQFWLKIRS